MIDPATTAMFAEAASAADGIERQLVQNAATLAALAAALRDQPPPFVITCARGSSDHAATYAKYLFETRLGWMTASAAPSVSSIYHATPAMRGALFIALSQSGRSPDLVATLTMARKQGARTLAIVNDASSPLAQNAEFVLPLHARTETSVAATKSYIGMLFTILWLVETVRGENTEWVAALPAQTRAAWDLDWSALVSRFRDASSLFVLGRGPGLGVAQEAALKFKETAAIHAEAFSAAEVRHGPMALAAAGMPMLVFDAGDEASAEVARFVDYAEGLGCDLLVTGRDLPEIRAHSLVQPILQVQSFYRAVCTIACLRGRDPDAPPFLSKVTATV